MIHHPIPKHKLNFKNINFNSILQEISSN